MTLALQADRLRHQVAEYRGHHYPPALVPQVLAHLQARRDHGETLASVAEDLGLSLDTLYRWLRDAKAQPRFSPAEVVAEFAPARASFTVLVPVRSTAPLRGGDSA